MAIGKNLGSVALLRTSLSMETIARRCGVSRPAASGWKNGKKCPSPEQRKKLQEFLGIDPDDWDKPADPETVTVAYPRALLGKREQVEADVTTHERRIHEILGECFSEIELRANMPIAEKIDCMNRAATALATLEKIERNKWEAWRKSPECKRFTEALRKGLQNHPKAAADVADALSELYTQVA